MTTKILIADDHAMVRDGLRPYLSEVGSDVEVLEASTLDEAISEAQKHPKLDLAILDLKMPGMNGVDGIAKFAKQFPNVRLAILSANFSKNEVLSAMNEGAIGYLPKTMGGASIVSALRLMLAGERFLPSVIMDELSNSSSGSRSGGTDENRDDVFPGLTRREGDILRNLVEGKSNKQIANSLGIEEITVKIHLRNVYRKIGVKNRAQAVRMTFERGWITADSHAN